MSDLDLLTIGLVNDMFTEKENDDFKYPYKPTQNDFDKEVTKWQTVSQESQLRSAEIPQN